MPNATSISDYNIIGTIIDTIDFSAFIAFETKSSDHEKLYIINKFPHRQSNNTIFKEFFSYYLSEKRSKDFVNFFSASEFFYIVFKYSKAQCIGERFEKDMTTDAFETRCDILNNILMKIDNLSSMPLNSQGILSNINCIGIDSNNSIQITYNLKNISSDKSTNSSELSKNIVSITKLLLQHELSSKLGNRLKIIFEKCKNNIYTSIPELIIDIKKAQKDPKNENLKNKIKLYIQKNKKIIKKYSIIGGVLVVVIGLISMLNSLINDHSKNPQAEEIVLLGTTKYNTNWDEGHDNTITPFVVSSDTENGLDNAIVLSPNADILSEDYIVQYGDTLESICKEYYGSENYTRTVESFNNISNAQLIAGLVIKLPDKSIVAG